jgi:hypothetical protein
LHPDTTARAAASTNHPRPRILTLSPYTGSGLPIYAERFL